ncbi:hypothetical protein Lalb_Chr23g0269871 [Lupinus albus]|uniref:Uncharacterized protein n=1 Tax=Lupinus albus TaxID=3870 RepID=A0A6A4NIF0_LUPAL|nr:hypothetical protein Lalb_Chr23g0269871 [Lupinus albus]
MDHSSVHFIVFEDINFVLIFQQIICYHKLDYKYGSPLFIYMHEVIKRSSIYLDVKLSGLVFQCLKCFSLQLFLLFIFTFLISPFVFTLLYILDPILG